jgi:membrane peptidoglycan carboxypeptidase
VVKQRVDFTPPAAPIPALERLRAPFLQDVRPPHGQPRLLLVGPESTDFIALIDVPPVFVRALLLSEDAGFYGHHGLDFAEMSVALATNWVRGTPARGASTITQQLAKNLFLTREKSVSRKLSEAALALLLDSTLGKQRVLEIYLNVIEWGPDIYGLRSASRHYFGKEPQELTIKETAFLVALIPGPIKYQRSFRDGALSPAFESLVANVLTKLRSVDAIDEAQYETALAEPLLIRPSAAPLEGNTDVRVNE